MSASLVLLALVFACAAPSALGQPPSGAQTPSHPAQSPPPAAARIDINRASANELAKIPGLAPTWAARIVRFRPYRTKEDLLERGIVPSDVYDRIKDYVIAHRAAPNAAP